MDLVRRDERRTGQNRIRRQTAIQLHGLFVIFGPEATLQARNQASRHTASAPHKAVRHAGQRARSRQVERIFRH